MVSRRIIRRLFWLVRNNLGSNGFVMRPTGASRRIAHKRAKAHSLVTTLIEACASMSMIGEETRAHSNILLTQ